MSVRVFYQLEGDGPTTVVLLNGVMMTVASWNPFVRGLGRRHRILRLDFRGQWLSPFDPPAEARDHADDVRAVLDAVGATRVHLVGTSFGGMVAGSMAARWPERIVSWTAIASPDHFDDGMLSEIARWRSAAHATLDGSDPTALARLIEEVMYSPAWRQGNGRQLRLRRAFFAKLPRSWFEGLDGLLASAPTADLRAVLGDVRCPTLVLAAEDDAFVPRERTEALAAAVAGAELDVIARCGHGAVVERPARTSVRVRRFLDGLC